MSTVECVAVPRRSVRARFLLGSNTMRERTMLRAAVSAFALGAIGCASQHPTLVDTPHASASESTQRVRALWERRADQGVARDFCLGVGDLVEVTVFHFPELQGTRARITPAGNIALPVIGEVHAAGLT